MTRTRIWALALALLMVATVATASNGTRGKRGPTVFKKAEKAKMLREAKQQRRFKRWLERQGEGLAADKAGEEYVDAIVVFKRRPMRVDANRLTRQKAFQK